MDAAVSHGRVYTYTYVACTRHVRVYTYTYVVRGVVKACHAWFDVTRERAKLARSCERVFSTCFLGMGRSFDRVEA